MTYNQMSSSPRILKFLELKCITFPDCLLVLGPELLTVALGIVLVIHDCSNIVAFSFGIAMISGGLLFMVLTILLMLCRNNLALLRIPRQQQEAERESRNSLDSLESWAASTFL